MTVITDPGRMALNSLEHLPIEALRENHHNPRHDLGDLDELAATILAHGLLQPLLVAPNADDTYTVIAGHRRLAALRSLTWTTPVPCVVREMTEVERMEAAVIENLQRRDLDPIDESEGFARLAELGLTQRQIAERVGCNQSHVSRRLKLQDLDLDLIALVRDDKLPLRLAEELVGEHDPDILVALERKAEKGPIGSYDVEQARTTVARKKLTAEGKATGLPELTDTWRGTHVDTAEEATHWCRRYDSTAGGYVVAFRRCDAERPASPSPTLERDAANRRADEEARAAKRQRAEERAVDRRRLAAAHLDDLFDVAVAAVLDRGYYPEDTEPDVMLALLGVDPGDVEEADVLADLIDSSSTKTMRRIFTAGAVNLVDREIEREYSSPESAGVYLDALNRWGWPLDSYEQGLHDRWRGDAPGIEPDDGDPSVGIDELDRAQLAERDEHLEESDPDGYVDIAGPPARPWATYDGNDERLIVKMVGNFTVAQAVLDVIAYEQVNGKRTAILDAAWARVHELGGVAS